MVGIEPTTYGLRIRCLKLFVNSTERSVGYAIKREGGTSRAGLVCDFLGNTGLRITSARNVRWSDVGAETIRYIGKGNRECYVPILPTLRPVLDRLRTLDDGSGFVLPMSKKNRGSIRTGLRLACKRAGLRQLTHHDFRHMFITRCIESGVDMQTVAHWVGHADKGALLSKRYFHLSNQHSRQAAARVRIVADPPAPPVAMRAGVFARVARWLSLPLTLRA